MQTPPRHLLLLLLFAMGGLLMLGCLGSSDSTPAPNYVPPAPLPPQAFPPASSFNATPASQAPLSMSFLNVGFGDATLIRSGPMTILLDTGPAESSQAVASALRDAGVEKIDVLILSSNNAQHVGGAPALMRQFVVGQVWENGASYSDANSQSIAQLAQFVPVQNVSYGYSQAWGNLTLAVLNPQSPLFGSPDADSIALKVSYGSFCALLFSESEASGAATNEAGTVAGGVDARIVTGPIPIQCQVLRVSHHGSGNAASFELLERMQPQVGIISVGPNPPLNSYPSPTLIRRLMLKNVSVYATDKLGTINVSVDANSPDGYNITSDVPADSAYWHFINDVAYNGKGYWPR